MIITDIDIDKSNDIWITGSNVLKYDGNIFEVYDANNSGVPNNLPYYLDTRCISIDKEENKWIGCASNSVSNFAIFKLMGEYAQESIIWTFDDLGLDTTSTSYEVKRIFANLFGGDIIAFITELNSPDYSEGYLFKYNINLNKWEKLQLTKNPICVYNIKVKAKGFEVKYLIATNIGLFIYDRFSKNYKKKLDQGSILSQVRILNKFNSPLLSSLIYDIEIDENNDVWLGTEEGLIFIKDEKYVIWNKKNFNPFPSNEIIKIKSIGNGQLILKIDNEPGIFYFNGEILENYNSSNYPNIAGDNIEKILLIKKKSSSDNLTFYPNDLLLMSRDSLSKFNYVIPHIKASAKKEGKDGWKFIEFDSFENTKLPKVSKYSWKYPSWRKYNEEYLKEEYPSLDTSNLFLEAPLEDIITQNNIKEFWLNKPELSLEDKNKMDEISKEGWESKISTPDNISNSNIGLIITNNNEIISFINIDNSIANINIGKDLNDDDVIINNSNLKSFGVLVYQNIHGQILGYNKIKGFNSEIRDIKYSKENGSIYILGLYDNFIEAGGFIYGEYPGGSLGGGPLNSPVGVTNIGADFLIGGTSDYPWIFSNYTGGGSGRYFPSWYDENNSGLIGIFIMEISDNLGSVTSFSEIDFSEETELEEKYFVKNFRHFPTSVNSFFEIKKIKLNITNLLITITGNILNSSSILYLSPNQYKFIDDNNSVPSSLGLNKGNLQTLSFLVLCDLKLNIKKAIDFKDGQGSGNISLINDHGLENKNNTILINGYAENISFKIEDNLIGGTNSGLYAFSILFDHQGNFINYHLHNNLLSINSISSFSEDEHYIIIAFNKEINSNIFNQNLDNFLGTYGLSINKISSSGEIKNINNYELEFNKDEDLINLIGINSSEKYIYLYYSIFNNISSSYNNKILKLNKIGSILSYTNKLFSSEETKTSLFNSYIKDENLVFIGNNLSMNTSSKILIRLFKSIKIVEGNYNGSIISYPGTNPWKWSNINIDDKNIQIPIMSNVFFSNSNSSIYGKNNYTWILKYENTNEEILHIKNSPYFIFTFTKEGIYSLYNSFEDSNGNFYEVDKKSFINIINHKKKKIETTDKDLINPEDYQNNLNDNFIYNDFNSFYKELDHQENEIHKKSNNYFSSLSIKKINENL